MLTKEHVYRIAYEALSQFTGKLNQARSFEEVKACIQKRLKYVFDYSVLRISFSHRHRHLHLTTGRDVDKLTTGENNLSPFEQEIRSKGIPCMLDAREANELGQEFSLISCGFAGAWAWNFSAEGLRNLTIILFTDEHHKFQKDDIAFLKLFAQSLESKLLEICLFEDIDRKNKSLNEALETISEKNHEIEAIIDHQKEIIESQTSELREKNRKLVDISMLNAHNVREPLSRILGLSHLFENSPPEELTDLIPMIRQSSEDLDKALQEVITMADRDIKFYKADL